MKVHTGVKNYVCDLCGYATTHKSYLIIHHRRHVGDFKFQCDVCDKRFLTVLELETHKKFHSGD